MCISDFQNTTCCVMLKMSKESVTDIIWLSIYFINTCNSNAPHKPNRKFLFTENFSGSYMLIWENRCSALLWTHTAPCASAYNGPIRQCAVRHYCVCLSAHKHPTCHIYDSNAARRIYTQSETLYHKKLIRFQRSDLKSRSV